jgi:hypothetical protein
VRAESAGDISGGSPRCFSRTRILYAPCPRLAIARAEYGADESGARLTNLTYLANALRKLESANEQTPLQNVTPATEHVLSSTH